MSYLLLADDHVFKCRSWDGLADKLVWAHDQGYQSAKARLDVGDHGPPVDAVRAGRACVKEPAAI